jgi:hypothetical protein
VSNKGKRIAAMAGQFRGGKLDPHYTGYFELFNQRKFYEAHDVLEHIWLQGQARSEWRVLQGTDSTRGRVRPSAKEPPATGGLAVQARAGEPGKISAGSRAFEFERNLQLD